MSQVVRHMHATGTALCLDTYASPAVQLLLRLAKHLNNDRLVWALLDVIFTPSRRQGARVVSCHSSIACVLSEKVIWVQLHLRVGSECARWLSDHYIIPRTPVGGSQRQQEPCVPLVCAGCADPFPLYVDCSHTVFEPVYDYTRVVCLTPNVEG